jgi:hypothetical protein
MVQGDRCLICLPLFAEDQEALPSTLAFLNTLLKRGEPRNLPLPRKNNSSTLTDLGSRLEHAVEERHRQIMSAQAPLKERIEDESDKGSGNEESANGSAKEESAKGAGNDESTKVSGNKEGADNFFYNPASTREERFLAYKEGVEKIIGDSGILLATPMKEGVPHSQESTNGSSTNEGAKDPSTQESSSASIADKNAKAMTDLMWQEHPSVPAQKSAKTVFFEESAKGSSQKWGDAEDEDMNDSPQKNDEGSSDSKDGDDGNKGHDATSEESASSSVVVVTEKSNKGSPSGKDEQDPALAKQCRKGSPLWVRGKMQEGQHALSHSPPNSPGRVSLGSPREDPEDEVMQIDAQGNT